MLHIALLAELWIKTLKLDAHRLEDAQKKIEKQSRK